MAALCALEKRCHRLICASDLNLFEVGAIILAVVVVRTVDVGRIDSFPCFDTSEHIIDFLALQLHLVFKLLFDNKHVGTGFAEEAEIAQGLFG